MFSQKKSPRKITPCPVAGRCMTTILSSGTLVVES